MNNGKQSQNADNNFSKQTTHGPQGVDKAPGEETPAAPDQFLQETQKGKKVDADPSKESDRPIEQE